MDYLSAYGYLRTEDGSVCGKLVEGGICGALDKPESDSEGDPFADNEEQ